MQNLQKFFGSCYAAEDIHDGDVVPVGGSNFLNGVMDKCVEADFRNLEPLFERAQKILSILKADDLTAWLASANINAEPDLFVSLWAFQAALSKVYPHISEEAPIRRRDFYIKGHQPLLSSVIEGKSAECAEIALIAHEWLNRQKLPNQYFSGSVLWNRTYEFSEQHSFIVIPKKQGAIVFDPANPVSTTQGPMPSIYRADSIHQLQRWEELRIKQNAFMILQNEISKTEALYGISNACNIDPEKHFVSHSDNAPVTKNDANHPILCERPLNGPVVFSGKKPSA